MQYPLGINGHFMMMGVFTFLMIVGFMMECAFITHQRSEMFWEYAKKLNLFESYEFNC